MTIKTDELMSIIETLPADTKAKLVERILNSLYSPQKDIDKLWADEVEKRVEEIKDKKVKTVPLNKVFEEVNARYSK